MFAADKIHTDDMPVPVLAPGTGKTKTGRLWVYARDDRGWQGIGPPAAAYFYTPDRKGERPRSHLANFSGFLQADGYAGYEQLYDGRRQPGSITEVACWAHVRRKIYDVWKATGSTTARTGGSMIDLMYEAEELGRGLPLEDRLERRQVVRVGVDGFFNWAEDTMCRISGKGALADAIRYAARRRAALTRFCDDARLEADNNRAENCLLPVALGRKTSSSPVPTRAASGPRRSTRLSRRLGSISSNRKPSCATCSPALPTVTLPTASANWHRGIGPPDCTSRNGDGRYRLLANNGFHVMLRIYLGRSYGAADSHPTCCGIGYCGSVRQARPANRDSSGLLPASAGAN